MKKVAFESLEAVYIYIYISRLLVKENKKIVEIKDSNKT